MSLATIIVILVLIVNFVLGVLVYITNPKNRTNKLFAATVFWIIIWNILYFLENQFFGLKISILFLKMDFASAVIMSYFWFLFCLNFPKPYKIPHKLKEFLLVLPVIIFVPLSFTSLIIKDFRSTEGAINFNASILYIPYAASIVAYLLGGCANLFLKYRKLDKKSIGRIQILYVLLGALLTLSIGVFVTLILPQFLEISAEISRIGIYSFFFLVIFTAYAITKHQLFNIRVIATETLTALIVLVFLIQTLLSKTLTEGLIRGLFLILVAYFGYFLIKSVIQEIERRKEVERLTRELEKANLHLQQLDKMKSEFVSIASHDLLTPVAAIEGYLSMILDEKIIPLKDHKLKDYLQRIYGSSKRLARLIADLLNISRIEEGRLLVDKKPCDIAAITETVVKELAIQADKHHLYLRFKKPAPGQKIPKVFADTDQIKEVLTNLIGNAIKFTKTGGVTIELEIVPKEQIEEQVAKLEQEVRQEAAKTKEMLPQLISAKSKEIIGPEQVVIHIKDTGIGMSQEELPNLFRKFYRGEGWLVSNIQGTGLGLYISKSLIELHNGRIWVDSEKGKGSDFAFSLPLAKNAQVLKQDKEGKIGKDEIRGKPLAKGPEKEF